MGTSQGIICNMWGGNVPQPLNEIIILARNGPTNKLKFDVLVFYFDLGFYGPIGLGFNLPQ
jgi:hypothetical protein